MLLGYDEASAHRLVAGADMILVPSRFEPCGLTQMYGLRYGTVPIVRRVGGLADTVRDAGTAAAVNPDSNGFVFEQAQHTPCTTPSPARSTSSVSPSAWAELMQRGMGEDLSWDGPASAVSGAV